MPLSIEKQRIYNDHLATSRSMRDKPFRIRKNFENFDKDKEIYLDRLNKFFGSYPNIDIKEYFSAPYYLYDDVDYFDLEYFTTQKAKKDYAQYMKQLELMAPDSEQSLKRLIQGFKFISKFCKERDLTLQDYMSFSEKNIPSVLEHLKNHDINFYVIHALGITKFDIDNRILDFMFKDFWKTFQKTKNMFYASTKMKKLAKQAIQKL
jgi:uncharacterized HAD superfamily protein